VVSREEIAVLSSTAGQACGRLELLAAAASLGFYIFSGMSTPAAASHHRYHGAYALGDLGSDTYGRHRSHRHSGSSETA